MRNVKNAATRALAVPMAAVMMVVGFGATAPATAAAGPGTAVPMTSVTGGTAEIAVDAAVAAVESGEVTTQSPRSALDVAEASVYRIDSADGAFTSVTLPVGGEYSLLSNVTVVFDAEAEVAQYTEMLVTENAAGNFAITSYSDGALVSTQDTDVAFVSDTALQADMDRQVQRGLDAQGGVTIQAKNTGACLAAVLGVGGTVGALIAWACAGSCAAAAAGVGVPFCVACVAAYATIGGASITAVASCF